MDTLFSHIVQKRLSEANEDVATDALAFILETSRRARSGIMKLIRGVARSMPELRFRAQQTSGNIRPDLWGFEDRQPRVFIENKFWAGFTENQPIAYLNLLAEKQQPTVLLVVVPKAREHTVWRELVRRLRSSDTTFEPSDEIPAGFTHTVKTAMGPVLGLTTWTSLISQLQIESADDTDTLNNLAQLKSLCEAADSEAFTPMSPEEVTDQRFPTRVLQLGTVMQTTVEQAISEGLLFVGRLRPQASWDRIGRYVNFPRAPGGVGAWIGLHNALWAKHGITPIWIVFYPSKWSRAPEVASFLEPWLAKQGVFTTWIGIEFAVAIYLRTGEEKDTVVNGIIEQLRRIEKGMAGLPPRVEANEANELSDNEEESE